MDVFTLTCNQCSNHFHICKKCYRGQTYCSSICSTIGYNHRRKQAQNSYQKTRSAKVKHALRQQKYRERTEKVTHKTRKQVQLDIKSSERNQSDKSCCFQCGFEQIYDTRRILHWHRSGRPKIQTF